MVENLTVRCKDLNSILGTEKKTVNKDTHFMHYHSFPILLSLVSKFFIYFGLRLCLAHLKVVHENSFQIISGVIRKRNYERFAKILRFFRKIKEE